MGREKITIHFKHERIRAIQSPFESCDVRRTEAKFSFSFQQMDAVRVFFLRRLDQISRSIRGAVINHKHIKWKLEVHDRVEHPNDVFPFVVGGDDDEAVVHVCE